LVKQSKNKEEGVTVKQEYILEAAIKRFSHFGIHKTTMTEISDDLAMSKQTLFYYYSDKQSLIKAVEEKIITEYLETLEKEFSNVITVELALAKLIEVKNRFFEKYFMLVSQVENTDALLVGKSMAEVKQNLREKESSLLVRVITTGVESNELNPLDPQKTASLLLDTLSAFAQCVRDKRIFPDRKDFREVVQKQKEVMRLCYNGLKR
jgi:TetR/AcrR family transcriptional repressor of mexJK operon